jgi:hypothetical protein
LTVKKEIGKRKEERGEDEGRKGEGEEQESGKVGR